MSSTRNSEAIAELGSLGARFVCWKWENRDGKRTKPPMRASGGYANSTDPATWCSLDDALKAAEQPGLDGIGFVLDAQRDGIVGIDLDGCRDPATGRIEPWATNIINRVCGYAEISPSGTGVKIVAKADPIPVFAANKAIIKKANGTGRDQAIEIYSKGRYFCLTGQILPSVPDEIIDATEAVEKLAYWIAKQARAVAPSAIGDLPAAFLDLLAKDDNLNCAWETGAKLGKGSDTSASALDWSLALHLRPHLDNGDIATVLRLHRHGQIGGGKLRGAAAERRLERILAELPPRRGATAGAVGGQVAEWPQPSPLPDGLPAVQEFDLILLPERLRPWVADIAERMQVPADYPAVAAMVSMATVVGRQIGIRPKRHDDWTVIPNLWGGIVGRPGLLKTPALQEACRPLQRLELASKDEFERKLKEYEAQQQIGKQRKKLRDDQIAKDLRAKRDPKGILHDILADSEEDNTPTRRRYIVNDSTIEKLGEILNQNPRGVMVFRDELTGFLRQMDRDGHEQDRAFYLESWNGTGRFTYDRIGRGTVDIEACCVNLLGGIQPGPLSAYLESMAHGGEGDDGLVQRLQLLVWPDVGKTWRNVDRKPDVQARRIASDVYDRLDRLSVSAAGAHQDDDGSIPYLRFDAEAQEAFDAWRSRLEARLRDGKLHPAMESHLAKHRSLVPSLALLCHLADVEYGAVGIVALERALAWAEYLETHAGRAYDAVIRGDLCAARVLGEHIARGDLNSPFSLRDVYRPGWSGLSSRESATAAVGVLVDLDWLRPEDTGPTPRGGRPTARYHINPNIGQRT